MPFFKRELGPVERFEAVLNIRRAEREKLGAKLAAAESALEDRRVTAERLAVAGAATARLERAEARIREFEEHARVLRAEVAEAEAQVLVAERALAEAMAQRDREKLADQIEAMAASIERAAPGFGTAAAALVEAVTSSTAQVAEASRFATSIDALRREVQSAVDLVCWELRAAAMRTRAGNANALVAPAEPEQSAPPDAERQIIYTLNPLSWREGNDVRRAPAFAKVSLPKRLLELALQHQHVDYLNARRVQTLMHVHGSGGLNGVPAADDPQLVDLDALASGEPQSAKAHVA